jgi:predicted nucleotidyltransferase
MTPTIQNLQASKQFIDDAAAKCGVEYFRVFGSVARGTSREGSDLDLLVKMKPGTTLLDVIGFEQILEDELGIPVDVIEEGGIHPLLERTILAEARYL